MRGDAKSLLDPRWAGQETELSERFHRAEPFPHLVLDGFLREDTARGLLEEFPEAGSMPRSRDYVFGDKRELSSVEGSGPFGAAFHSFVTGEEFAGFLTAICGFDVFVDPAFHGGGFHRGEDGSFLDLHVDFNVHPLHENWLRTLNVLLYLSDGWKPEWGGQLLLKSGPEDDPVLVEPKFNRGVIMATHDRTFHGYRRMSLPPGTTRLSVATYAYRLIDPTSVRARTTGWAPEEAPMTKRILARHYDRLVRAKNRIAGSGTAKNR